MPDWFVVAALASLVGGLAFFVQMVGAGFYRLFVAIRDFRALGSRRARLEGSRGVAL